MIDKLQLIGKFLLDTNVIIYADNLNSSYYSIAKEIRDRCVIGELNGCLTPQNLLEYFAVVTDSRKVEFPLSPKEAIAEVNKYYKMKTIQIIYPKVSTFNKVIQLVKKYKVKRQEIFDIQLVATMLDNAIKSIVTRNEKHFKVISEIDVINPFVLDSSKKTKEQND